MDEKQFVTGRPKFEVSRDVLIQTYDIYQRWDKVAEHLGLSLRTVMRRVKEYNIKRVHTSMQ